MVLVAGFAAGAVITIAALVKGLEEASDITTTAKQAVKASQDFQAGFCSAYGVAVPGDGDLFKAGRSLGLKKMAAELDAYAEYKKMKEGIDLDEAQRKEVVAIWRAAAAKKSGKFRKMVQGQFDAAIKAQLIAAWAQEERGHQPWRAPRGGGALGRRPQPLWSTPLAARLELRRRALRGVTSGGPGDLTCPAGPLPSMIQGRCLRDGGPERTPS